MSTLTTFAKSIIKTVTTIESADQKNAEKKRAVMEELEKTYNRECLMEGGFNGNAFKEGTKDDTRAKAASDAGLSVSQAVELYSIIKGINDIRSNIWQEYQRAYFGRNGKPREEDKGLVQLKVAEKESKDRLDTARAEMKKANALVVLATSEDEKEMREQDAKEAKAVVEEYKAAYSTAKDKVKDYKSSRKAKGKKETVLDALQVIREYAEGIESLSAVELVDELIEVLS